ncbi:RasGEF [Acrasis kona]|uniref:RasGEF n=1 Tax=Acrasis kona TaxID=1008807 RepID=A0AAW2ZQ15_9EUKA
MTPQSTEGVAEPMLSPIEASRQQSSSNNLKEPESPSFGDNHLRREAKRQNVLQEILSTEKTYVKALYILSSHFIRPISRGNIITREVHEKIFNEIEMIIKINETFLSELEKIMTIHDSGTMKEYMKHAYSPSVSKFTGGFSLDESKSGFCVDPLASQASQVALLLLFYAQSFKLYIGYITNFKNAAEEYRAEKKRNKNFKDLCSLKHKTLIKEGQRISDLEGFLICPVQRIPRYRLLMEELLENMNQTDEGYDDIKSATQMITGIAMYCNERSSAVDKSVRIIEIVEKLNIDKFQFIIPSRRFVCEELSSVKMIKNKQLTDCDVYLFSDLILIVTCVHNLLGKKKNKVRQFSLRKGASIKDKQINDINVHVINPSEQPSSASGVLKRIDSFSETFVDVGINVEWYLSKVQKSDNAKKVPEKNMPKITLVCDSKEQAIRLCDSIKSCVR